MLCTTHRLYVCFISLLICFGLTVSVYWKDTDYSILGKGVNSKTIDSWIQKEKWYAKFAAWNCTSYAASRRPDIFPSRNGRDRPFWGNAIAWYQKAKNIGLSTWKKPWTWAIAIYWAGRWASSSLWHVAIVERIIDEHTIEVTDMNYLWLYIVTRRIVKSNLAIGYIYKKEEKKHTRTSIKIEPITIDGNVKEQETLVQIETLNLTNVGYITDEVNTTVVNDAWSSQATNKETWEIKSDNNYAIIYASKHRQIKTSDRIRGEVWFYITQSIHHNMLELSG